MLDAKCEYFAKSVHFSSVVVCEQERFLDAIRAHPRDLERYHLIRDQALQSLITVANKCFSCERYGHSITFCPQMHFEIDKEVFIRRSLQSEDQKREAKVRRTGVSGKFNSLLHRQRVKCETKRQRLMLLGLESDYDSDDSMSDRSFFLAYDRVRLKSPGSAGIANYLVDGFQSREKISQTDQFDEDEYDDQFFREEMDSSSQLLAGQNS